MNDKPGNKKKIPIFAYYIILLGIVLIISYTMLPKLMEPDYKEISFSEFVQKVENDEAQQVEVNSKQYTMKPKDFETSTFTTSREILTTSFTKARRFCLCWMKKGSNTILRL